MRKTMLLAAVFGLLLVLGAVTPVFAETITGEVIDTFCYAKAGAKGEGHRACAIDCINKGIPAGLLDGSGNIYVLLPNKDRSPLPKEVVDKAGRKATITGKVIEKGGSKFLVVESVK